MGKVQVSPAIYQPGITDQSQLQDTRKQYFPQGYPAAVNDNTEKIYLLKSKAIRNFAVCNYICNYETISLLYGESKLL